jgi:hypothetical protein
LEISYRSPEVLLGSGKDMRYAEPVEPHFDGSAQAGEGDSSV